MKNSVQFLGFTFISVLVILFCVEVYFSYVLNHPHKCPAFLKPTLRCYYHEYDQSIAQYEPTLAQYDSSLFYTLKPGHSVFTNREFSVEFNINSKGLRDDEASLDYPQIIVVGDSYTMGWGVEQDSTYAQILERKRGVSVLNMGISSYGTAREFLALNRIKMDSLKYLIIQYCPNDLSENEAFYKNENVLKVSDRVAWEKTCQYRKSRTAYYPLKHVLTIPGVWAEVNHPKKATPNTAAREKGVGTVEAFLNVLRSSKKVPATTQIILFNLEAEYVNNGFVSLVKNSVNQQYSSTLHDQISYLDLTGKIDSTHRFIWDPHLNSRGHSVVANLLEEHFTHLPRGYEKRYWFYDTGDTSIVCEYMNGYKHGLFKAFWPNGNVSRTSHFQFGKMHGVQQDFTQNGEVVLKH